MDTANPTKNNINFQSSLKMLYPTPILKHKFDDMDETNKKLKTLLLAKEKEHPEWRTGSAQRSNMGGWRTQEDLSHWKNPDIHQLVLRLNQAIGFLNNNKPIKDAQPMNNVDIFSWANINRQGQYNTAHIHPGFHWGAVYYVATGEPNDQKSNSGKLEFQDPRGAASAMPIPGYEFGHKYTIEPEAGTLIVFPAWMIHSVHPFQGKGERISIAFNIRLKP